MPADKSQKKEFSIISDTVQSINNPNGKSLSDTTIFHLSDCKFTITATTTDTNYNSANIVQLLKPCLKALLERSAYVPKNYSFAIYSECDITTSFLSQYEQPGQAIVYHNLCTEDSLTLIYNCISKFSRFIYIPVHYQYNTSINFRLPNHKCEEHLWFYNGVTEYLSLKVLYLTGLYSRQRFLEELERANLNYKHIDLSQSSCALNKSYPKKIGSFYDKGSLFAFSLDIELIRQSKCDLWNLLKFLQNHVKNDTCIRANGLFELIENKSNKEIRKFIEKHVTSRKGVKFNKLLNHVNFYTYIEPQKKESWSFNLRELHYYSSENTNSYELCIKGSLINRKLNSRKVIIKKINEKYIDTDAINSLKKPVNGSELSLLVEIKGKEHNVLCNPKYRQRTVKTIQFRPSKQPDDVIAKAFWKINESDINSYKQDFF